MNSVESVGWHQRSISTQEDAAFQRIRIWADLTQTWSEALHHGPAKCAAWKDHGFEDLVGSESARETLFALETQVFEEWIELLEHVRKNARGNTALPAAILEQSAWSHGQALGRSCFGSEPFPTATPVLKRFAHWMEALSESSSLQRAPHFVSRLTAHEFHIDLGFCPHQLTGDSETRDLLCHYRDQWFRGFAYSAHPLLILQESKHAATADNPRRCSHAWILNVPNAHS